MVSIWIQPASSDGSCWRGGLNEDKAKPNRKWGDCRTECGIEQSPHTHLKAGVRHRFTTVPGVRSRQTQASAVNLPMTCLIRWSNSCLLFFYYNCSGNPPASIFCLCSGPLAYLGGSHLSHVVVLKRLLMNKPVSLSSPLILHRPTELQFRYSKLSHCVLSHFISGNLF